MHVADGSVNIDSSDDMREDDDPFFNDDFGEGYEEKPKKGIILDQANQPKKNVFGPINLT